VPATVTVTAGSTSQTFEIDTVGLQIATATTTATITALYGGLNQSAILTIATTKLSLVNMSVSASTVAVGSAVTATIMLSTTAANGTVIALESSSPAAIVPASVTVPSGSSSQTFGITIVDSAAATTATISATYAGSTRTVTLTVAPRLALQSVALALISVPGGLSPLGTVTLTAAAPAAGAVVSLASNSPSASVPPSVTVAAGTTTQTFLITTVNAPPTTIATITATYAGASQTATLTVVAYPVISSLSCSPGSPSGGTPVVCAGTLASPAPAGGWQLSFASSDPSAVVPSSLAVPSSSQTFQFTVTTVTVSITTNLTIQIFDAPSGLTLFTQFMNITP
jgi:hypothetical protein